MCHKRTMSTRVLSHMARRVLLAGWLVLALCACTVRSGEQVVVLQSTPNQLSAMAVRFVGSEGVMWRTIRGLQPDVLYQVDVQAQVVSGAMQLHFRDQLGRESPLLVVPGRVATATMQVRSDAQGMVMLEEMTYQSRGGEYQLRFIPLNLPSMP